jgi:hypothetical protein
VNPVQLEMRITCCQGPRSKPGCNWAHDHFFLLPFWLTLLILPALLVLLLISCPDKGRITIIFPMSRLTYTLLLCCTSGTLLLTPSSTITSATTSRHCSLPGQHILASLLAADILVSLAGTLLNYCLLSSDCRIIHLDLLVPAARGHTSSTPGAWMQGQSFAPRSCASTSHGRNVLGCPGTWVCLLKGLLLLGSFRQKMVKPGLLLMQCFAGQISKSLATSAAVLRFFTGEL